MKSPIRSASIRAGLFVVLVTALFIRSWGINWGLPKPGRFTTLYVDEYTPLWALHNMNPKAGDFNPHYAHNPTFFYYQVGAVLAAASKLGAIRLGGDKNYYLDHPEQYARLYLAGRWLCVAYGVAATLVLFFLGRRVSGSEEGGLLTSLFYAAVPISAIQCHVIDTSVPASFWLAFSAWGFLEALDSGSRRWLFMASIAAGLSFSTKYTCAPIMPVAAYAAWRTTGRTTGALLALAIAAAAYAAGSPYVILDARHMMAGLLEMSQNATGAVASPSAGTLVYPLAHFAYGVGIPLSLSATAGLFMQWRARRPAAVLALLFLIPYLGLLARSYVHMARYVNETLPFLLPFAAVPILTLFHGRRLTARWAAAALLLLCVSRVPYALAIDRSLASETDPRDLASDWFAAHVAQGSRVGLDHEANFMTPAHLYMDFWKGKRYPADFVPPPHYEYSSWEKTRWDLNPPRYWVGSNLYMSGVFKNAAERTQHDNDIQMMREGYRVRKTFARELRWGPFQFAQPKLAGNDWRIFIPEITVYERG